MHKIYYLSTCNTCKRIIDDLELKERGFQFQDIKSEPITEEQLDEMYRQSDSYESLFNKRARKYRDMQLKDKNLSEDDFKSHILKEYTFLKRPVFIIDDEFEFIHGISYLFEITGFDIVTIG